ncbi:MAG TPA: bifunctional pyr operon transcriptional regulator/uracil phosphoribosyltransferase PyrR [Acidimicrobiales bacterium]|nr:bifunctional pyr operon transcriptional regulator/uracil phosphoribosyltransferase PyrR [Acidimicrobiales bacterium]
MAEDQSRAAAGSMPSRRLLDAEAVARAVRRMAHEVLERADDPASLVVVGLQTGGVPFAGRLADDVSEVGAIDVPRGALDVAFYRDDLDARPLPASAVTDIPMDLTDRTVVVVDDVLYTGRTVRAALNALADWGRPRAVRLAVMVDRGHRELPIRPDYVGKNLPTSHLEAVVATLDGVWIGPREGA